MGRVTNRYDVYDKRGKLLAHDITVPEFADAYRLNRFVKERENEHRIE